MAGDSTSFDYANYDMAQVKLEPEDYVDYDLNMVKIEAEDHEWDQNVPNFFQNEGQIMSEIKTEPSIFEYPKTLMSYNGIELKQLSIPLFRIDEQFVEVPIKCEVEDKIDMFQCGTCDMIFESLPILCSHMTTIHWFRKTCLMCSCCYQKFNNMKAYLQHEQMHKFKSVPFFCSRCAVIFPSKKKLIEHKSKHKRKFKCKFCKKTFKTKKRRSRHSKKHEISAVNDATSSKYAKFKKLSTKSKDGDAKSKECSTKSKDSGTKSKDSGTKSMDSVIKSKASGSRSKGSGTKSTPKKAEKRKKLKSGGKGKRSIVKIKQEQIDTLSDIQPLPQFGILTICGICDAEFSNFNEFNRHMNGEIMHKCNVCSKFFNSKCVLQQHTNNFHMNQMECKYCSQKFYKVEAFYIHVTLMHTTRN